MRKIFTILNCTLLTFLISLFPFRISNESSINANEIRQAEIIRQTAKNQAILSDFTKFYEGTIDKKYKISMSLTKTEKNLDGTYMYKSQGIPIKIKGSIDRAGSLILNEFDDNGNMTGIFKGRLSATNISGQWAKPDGTKPMPFILTETSATKNESELLKKPLNWGGKYVDKFGVTLEIDGSDLNTNEAFQFELTEATSRCAEQITGTAKLTNQTMAVFKNDELECSFHFKLSVDQIEIQSKGWCVGAACGGFAGIYKKTK